MVPRKQPSIGAGVGSLLSGTAGTIVGAPLGAIAGQVVVTGLPDPEPLQPTEIVTDTVVTHAPTNLWDVVS